jgi:hypothetical protein
MTGQKIFSFTGTTTPLVGTEAIAAYKVAQVKESVA